MLYFTSFGFGLVSLLFKDKRTWLRPGLVILMGTSILHHSKSHETYRGKRFVAAVDKALAHAVTIGALFRGLVLHHPVAARTTAIYAMCTSYVAYAYHIGRLCHRPKPHGEVYHASLHLAAFVGLAACALSGPR